MSTHPSNVVGIQFVNVGWFFGRYVDPHIRESVDSLYRDDTDEISRDPRTKRLKTRRESLPRPSKHTSNSLRANIYLYMFPKISNAPSVIHERIRS